MPERTCTLPDCGKPHRAKGLCITHYNQGKPARHKVAEMACAQCGVKMTRFKRTDRANQFCSYSCRGDFQWGANRKALVHVGPAPVHTVVPRRHPARTQAAARAPRQFVSGNCEWCGTNFTVVGQVGRFCTEQCARSAGNARYRQRRGRFTIPLRDRLAIYARDNWTCQLCKEPVDRSLPQSDVWGATLDHIECQSWALAPDHSAANLRLAHRWCNSVRGDETYYRAGDLLAV